MQEHRGQSDPKCSVRHVTGSVGHERIVVVLVEWRRYRWPQEGDSIVDSHPVLHRPTGRRNADHCSVDCIAMGNRVNAFVPHRQHVDEVTSE